MSTMFDVWVATSIFIAQSIKLQYLSIFDTPSGVTKFAGKNIFFRPEKFEELSVVAFTWWTYWLRQTPSV